MPPRPAQRPALPASALAVLSRALRVAGLPLRSAAWLALGVLLLAGCGPPRPEGELRAIQDDQFRISNPSQIGATATGAACGSTSQEALTSAQRVAQFNLRRLTGPARYNVHLEPVSERHTPEGICIEVSATSVEPRPFVR
jgi:hypothetical protein